MKIKIAAKKVQTGGRNKKKKKENRWKANKKDNSAGRQAGF